MNLTIGANIKKLRNQKHITQDKLAENLGVTPQAISRWESGAGFPAIEYLPDLAAFFSVSVDELLGVKQSEREARREEIYQTIGHIEECGYNPSAIDLLREAHADFPSDEKISLALAKALRSEMYEDEPNNANLKEAEKILLGLIRNADEYDFKFSCVKELAVIYKEVWEDEDRYKEALEMLPSLNSCREIFLTDYYNGGKQDPETVRSSLLTLSVHTMSILRDYIVYSLPNEPEHWDVKIGYFEEMIDFCNRLIEILGEETSGDENSEDENPYEKNTAEIHITIAVLYRYTATYCLAKGQNDEALNCLENMVREVEAAQINEAQIKMGTAQDSSAHDSIPQTGTIAEKAPHSAAWYFLPYLKHERYDAVRGDKRFEVLKDKLTQLTK